MGLLWGLPWDSLNCMFVYTYISNGCHFLQIPNIYLFLWEFLVICVLFIVLKLKYIHCLLLCLGSSQIQNHPWVCVNTFGIY